MASEKPDKRQCSVRKLGCSSRHVKVKPVSKKVARLLFILHRRNGKPIVTVSRKVTTITVPDGGSKSYKTVSSTLPLLVVAFATLIRLLDMSPMEIVWLLRSLLPTILLSGSMA